MNDLGFSLEEYKQQSFRSSSFSEALGPPLTCPEDTTTVKPLGRQSSKGQALNIETKFPITGQDGSHGRFEGYQLPGRWT